MIRTAFQTMHPFGQFIFFCCLILTGMGLASGLGLFLVTQWTGESMLEAMASMSASDSPNGRTYNLILNSINQLLSFGAAAFLARYLFKGQTLVTGRMPQSFGWIAWGIVFAWCAQPLIDVTYRLNALCMELLPTAWVTQADLLEKMAQKVTVSLLSFDDAWHFPATLVAVAVLPAICEEMAFRGVLQPLFARWTRSIHAGIWISALLFSAIHLQFHGFLPRMILGAGLGYLVHYSGSLWPAIVSPLPQQCHGGLLSGLVWGRVGTGRDGGNGRLGMERLPVGCFYHPPCLDWSPLDAKTRRSLQASSDDFFLNRH